MQEIGDIDFTVHFMDGYWGRDYKGKTELHKSAYSRGYDIKIQETMVLRENSNEQNTLQKGI